MAIPECPDCGSAMVLRTARRGRNRGGQFYGCSTYPRCRGTASYEGDLGSQSAEVPPSSGYLSGTVPVEIQAGAIRRRVPWNDGSTQRRDGWDAWVVPVGGGFRSFDLHPAAQALSTDTWIAVSSVGSYEPADDDTVRVCSMVRKLLQRGATAPVHPDAERALLGHLGAAVDGSLSENDVAPILDVQTAKELASRRPARPFPDEAIIGGLAWDSDEERRFHCELVPKLLGDGAGRWLLPQAPLDDLLVGRGADLPSGGQRRVDFLVAAPGQEPFVIEIDGQQHDSCGGVDDARDDELARVGIDVLRIPAVEIRQGAGPGIDQVLARWKEPELVENEDNHLLLAPAQMNRLMLALITAVEQGFLLGERWVVEIDDELNIARGALGTTLNLIAAVDDLWGQRIAPQEVWVRADGIAMRYERRPGGYRALTAQSTPDYDVKIVLDTTVSPVELMPEQTAVPTVVTRPAVLPVEIRMDSYSTVQRVSVRTDRPSTEAALSQLLCWLFARPRFREGQREAIQEVLEGRDAVVLLPTGAGKSLIYQLAGLLLPGVTLVVDPIVALMEDQVRGLRQQGVDRVIGISSHLVQQGFREELLARVGSGDAQFIFVAPERLQQSSFRDALQQLTATTMVNLAVADEAHCVSEWGHDFRTAYLRLGPVLRRVCADASGTPPPLLALTGTASRSVLRDVLFELEIDAASSPNTTIRPRTFDRPELEFSISVGDPESSEARLKAAVQGMPHRFRRRQGFFERNGPRTNSGITFAPYVNGGYGVADIAKILTPVVGHKPTVYSGSAPRSFRIDARAWGDEKRRNAESFQRNEIPTLVATKSFGMGIDKPNVRWIVHYGIPGSIEAYYQEAGRAGRDGKRAHCCLVFSEFTEEQDRQLLNADVGLEEIRSTSEAVGRRESDDVTRMLWFYLNSFPGIEGELEILNGVVEELGEVARVRVLEIPMSNGKGDPEQRERALHRLVLLGVIDDYTVDYGAKSFGVRLAPSTVDQVLRSLLGFVGRTQPARAVALAGRLDAGEMPNLQSAIHVCARELMEFVYDTIAASRLRSLREMWLAARQGDGEELRRRIVDYFNEGSGAPTLEALLDRTPFRFDDWLGALGQIHLPEDATEWRGASARLLVSEPEHPGLLLIRAITEELSPAGSSAEFGSNLSACFEHAVGSYGVSRQALRALSENLAELLRSDPRVPPSKRRDAPLILAALRPLGDQALVDDFVRLRLQGGPVGDEDLAPAFLADQLMSLRNSLQPALDSMVADALIKLDDRSTHD